MQASNTNNYSDFKQVIENDEKLQKLLYSYEVKAYTRFDNPLYQTEEFRKHIEKDYLQSLRTIIKQNLGTDTEFKIVGAVRSMKYLASQEVKDEMYKLFNEHISKSLEQLQTIKTASSGADTDFLKLLEQNHQVINDLVITSIAEFGEEEALRENKRAFLALSLNLCDILANYKASTRNTGKYAMYNVLVNNLETIPRKGEYTEAFERHTKTINKKRQGVDNKYVIGSVVLGIWIIFKIVRALAR